MFSHPVVTGFDKPKYFTALLFLAVEDAMGMDQFPLEVQKKLSATALSQQFPLQLIPHSILVFCRAFWKRKLAC